jgi:hypothetical protein
VNSGNDKNFLHIDVSALSEMACIDADKSEKAVPPAPEQEYAFLLPGGSQIEHLTSELNGSGQLLTA